MSFDINAPLIEFSDERETARISIKDSFSGIFITGATGSGKSSGSARHIALKFLKYGFGGLVLCAKPELETWKEYCRLTGREKDLIVLKPNGEHSFNFLEYESSQKSETTFVSNLTSLLQGVIETNKQKKEGRSDDPFWSNSLTLLIHNCISLCMLAFGKVSLPKLYDIALSIKSDEADSVFNKALETASQIVADKIDVFGSVVGKSYLDNLNNEDYNQILFEAIPESRELHLLIQFFNENFKKLGEKTRSIIELSFISFLFNLMQQPVYDLFCSRPSTFTPESSFLESKIILLDLPTKIYGQAGHFVQLIFKGLYQRACEKRDLKTSDRSVFIFSDECQEMISENDNKFLATARSSMVSNCYITQNLPNLYACMGAENAMHRIKGMLGNFATKIMHCNTDVETNTWSESLIGKAFQADETETITTANGSTSTAKGISVKLQSIVRKEAFGMLKCGGDESNFRVSAYIHVQGKTFTNGFNHRLIHFNQNFQPKL